MQMPPGKSPAKAGPKIRHNTAPINFAPAEPAGRDFSHAQPSPPISKGRKKAATPSTCSSRSDKRAPTNPVQLWAGRNPGPNPPTVLKEGSVGR